MADREDTIQDENKARGTRIASSYDTMGSFYPKGKGKGRNQNVDVSTRLKNMEMMMTNWMANLMMGYLAPAQMAQMLPTQMATPAIMPVATPVAAAPAMASKSKSGTKGQGKPELKPLAQPWDPKLAISVTGKGKGHMRKKPGQPPPAVGTKITAQQPGRQVKGAPTSKAAAMCHISQEAAENEEEWITEYLAKPEEEWQTEFVAKPDDEGRNEERWSAAAGPGEGENWETGAEATWQTEEAGMETEPSSALKKRKSFNDVGTEARKKARHDTPIHRVETKLPVGKQLASSSAAGAPQAEESTLPSMDNFISAVESSVSFEGCDLNLDDTLLVLLEEVQWVNYHLAAYTQTHTEVQALSQQVYVLHQQIFALQQIQLMKTKQGDSSVKSPTTWKPSATDRATPVLRLGECHYFVKHGICVYPNCKFTHPQRQAPSPTSANQSAVETSTRAQGAEIYNSQGLPKRSGQLNCKNYMQKGICLFGGNCKWNHPEVVEGISADQDFNSVGLPLVPEAPTCEEYRQSGACCKGCTCTLNHPETPRGSQGATATYISPGGTPVMPGQCVFFINNGFCNHGDACRYEHPATIERHDPPALVGECNFFVKNGYCFHGDSCKYEHPAHIERRDPPPGSVIGECNFFVKAGWCKNGDSCRYEHPTHIERRNPLGECKYFADGGCVHGDDCKYDHTVRKSGTSDVPPECNFFVKNGWCKNGDSCRWEHPSYVTRIDPPQAGDCNFYVKHGYCIHGDSCRYEHPARIPPQEPPAQLGTGECIFFQNGFCKHGDSCRFEHRTDASPHGSTAVNSEGLPRRPGKEACAFYMKHGSCRFSLECVFDHPEGREKEQAAFNLERDLSTQVPQGASLGQRGGSMQDLDYSAYV